MKGGEVEDGQLYRTFVGHHHIAQSNHDIPSTFIRRVFSASPERAVG
jgi:hypothetical protein